MTKGHGRSRNNNSPGNHVSNGRKNGRNVEQEIIAYEEMFPSHPSTGNHVSNGRKNGRNVEQEIIAYEEMFPSHPSTGNHVSNGRKNGRNVEQEIIAYEEMFPSHPSTGNHVSNGRKNGRNVEQEIIAYEEMFPSHPSTGNHVSNGRKNGRNVEQEIIAYEEMFPSHPSTGNHVSNGRKNGRNVEQEIIAYEEMFPSHPSNRQEKMEQQSNFVEQEIIAYEEMFPSHPSTGNHVSNGRKNGRNVEQEIIAYEEMFPSHPSTGNHVSNGRKNGRNVEQEIIAYEEMFPSHPSNRQEKMEQQSNFVEQEIIAYEEMFPSHPSTGNHVSNGRKNGRNVEQEIIAYEEMFPSHPSTGNHVSNGRKNGRNVEQEIIAYEEMFPSHPSTGNHVSNGRKNGRNVEQEIIAYEEMFPSHPSNRQEKMEQQSNFVVNKGGHNVNREGPGRGEYRENEYQRKVHEERQQKNMSAHHKNTAHNRNSNHVASQAAEKMMRNRGNEDKQVVTVQKNTRDQKDSLDMKAIKCSRCSDVYDNKHHIPKSLQCGHSICLKCLKDISRKSSCPECNKSFKADDAITNYALAELVANIKADTHDREEHGPSCRPKEKFNKDGTFDNHNRSDKDKHFDKKVEQMDWLPSEKSPHDSRCLDAGQIPSSHCATCQKWVCDQCGSIDHSTRKGCYLIPKQEALRQMKNGQENVAKSTHETMENTMSELNNYERSLHALSLTMQAAFESIACAKEHTRSLKEEGKKKLEKLDSAVEALPDKKNVETAVKGLKLIEDHCGEAQRWTSCVASKTLDIQKINGITKDIFLGCVKMNSVVEGDVKKAPKLFPQHIDKEGVRLYCNLETEGGRAFVYALQKMETLPAGSRSIPLNSLMCCIDPSRTLTFFEIGWGNEVKGRILIRLLGDTLRGRQFVRLCTGEAGPSFRGMNFHRVWWKGLPGEHIWGGDYKNGDGSGGKSILKSDDRSSNVLPGKCLAIKGGLVAGRYEESNISSIFRIYTKEATEGNREGSYLEEFVESKDEAAFAKVEYGLQILATATHLKNITDAVVVDCGVVIET